MSEQKYKDEIEKLTKQLKDAENEHQFTRGVIQSLELMNESLKHINESLETKVRVRGQELVWHSDEISAYTIEMVRMTQRIRELEITNATQREKELEDALNISQLARNDLRIEFEKMRDLYEKTDKYKIFSQLMTEYDNPEIKSLTEEQFDTKIKRFFKMMSDQYPDDKQQCLDHGRKAWKWLSLTLHPDKNSNDPCATEKFKAFNQAYENFTK